MTGQCELAVAILGGLTSCELRTATFSSGPSILRNQSGSIMATVRLSTVLLLFPTVAVACPHPKMAQREFGKVCAVSDSAKTHR
jgi:hypothetical protein